MDDSSIATTRSPLQPRKISASAISTTIVRRRLHRQQGRGAGHAGGEPGERGAAADGACGQARLSRAQVERGQAGDRGLGFAVNEVAQIFHGRDPQPRSHVGMALQRRRSESAPTDARARSPRSALHPMRTGMMPLASPEMQIVVIDRAGGARRVAQGLDRKAAMARQRPHIVAVGQRALASPARGRRRFRFRPRAIRRPQAGPGSGDGGCSRFRDRVRAGHESVRDLNPALNPGAGRKTYRAHAGRAARHGTQASAWPPHDTHMLRYDCENDCQDCKTNALL